jgi:hypothetical protein
MSPLVFGACTSLTGPKKDYPPPPPYLDYPPPERNLPMVVHPPEASSMNLPDFLFSEVFFPANASRIYDLGEPLVPAGPEKLYAQFPTDEPCPSPDGKWRWRFFRYETDRAGIITRKVLDLEGASNEQQMEIMLSGRTIRILWASDGGFTAITSWDDEQTMRVDLVSTLQKWTKPLVVDRFELARFFSSTEMEGKWSMKAHAWKTNSVLIVRAIRIGTKATDKLCGAEFSVGINRNRDQTVRLLRAFICE